MPWKFNGYLWQHLYFWPIGVHNISCNVHVWLITCTCSSCPYDHHSIGWQPISPSLHWMTAHLTIIPLDDPPISPSSHWMTTHLTIIPLDDHPSHNHTIGWPPISPSSKSSHVCIRILMGGPFGHNFDVQYIKCLPHSHTNGIVSAFRNPN
jgi:hypothetical protein